MTKRLKSKYKINRRLMCNLWGRPKSPFNRREYRPGEHGLDEIGDIFGRGVKIEVGDMLPSAAYAERLKRVPPAWEKAFEVNPAHDPAVRAACVEFVLAGLYVTDRISRSQRHGRIMYEIS